MINIINNHNNDGQIVYSWSKVTYTSLEDNSFFRGFLMIGQKCIYINCWCTVADLIVESN